MASGKWGSGEEQQLIAYDERSRQWRRRWIFRVLAVSLSLTVCFLVLETILRIWGPEYHRFNTLPIYDSNPRGYFDELSQEDGRQFYTVFDHYWIEGARRFPDDMRSEAQFEAFKARRFDVLALGDSFTYGRGVRYDDTYVRQLEQRLARDGRPLQIDNLGFAGYGIEDIRNAYRRARQPGRFPLVLYGFVLNDFGLPGADQIVGSDYIDLDNGGNQPSSWRERSALVNFICHHVDTIRTDRITKKAYLAAFEGENARTHFAELAELNRQVTADGGRLVILLFPLLHQFDRYPFQIIHEKLAAFCKEEGVPLVDLLPAYSRYDAESLWVHPTDHHPNEIAHRIAAQELHEFLKQQNLLPPAPAAQPPAAVSAPDDSAEQAIHQQPAGSAGLPSRGIP